jgi:hypothetical protein
MSKMVTPHYGVELVVGLRYSRSPTMLSQPVKNKPLSPATHTLTLQAPSHAEVVLNPLP